MARQLFLAITLMGMAVLLYSPAQAAIDAPRCEDNAANCVGRCANPGAGTHENRCMLSCDRRVTRCLVRAYNAVPRRW